MVKVTTAKIKTLLGSVITVGKEIEIKLSLITIKSVTQGFLMPTTGVIIIHQETAE